MVNKIVYSEHDKKIYNRGFYSGARYIVMRIISHINGKETVECFKCGDRNKYNLELHDKIRPDKTGEKGNNRNFDDWIYVENLEIYCSECHSETDGYRGRGY